jgi:hypothetical protein
MTIKVTVTMMMMVVLMMMMIMMMMIKILKPWSGWLEDWQMNFTLFTCMTK